MGGDTGDRTRTSERGSLWPRLRIAVAIVGIASVVIAGAILWRHLAVGDGTGRVPDRAPLWVAGYVASPQDAELIVVLKACEEWNLDEYWLMPPASNADRVEVYIGWWSMSLPPCDTPQLRTISVGLSEPLGDRRVFISGGGEILPFVGDFPAADR